MQKVERVMKAEQRNYNALVLGGPGGYRRLDEATKEPIPDPRARPQAG